MKSLKINFGGANSVSIDWNSSVDGLVAVAQRVGVSLLTQLGSDKLLPDRGTEVARTLFSYGAFDMLGLQHTLNFGALKARSDMLLYDEPARAAADSVASIKTTLIAVKDNVAQVGITVTNRAGQTTQEIKFIA